MIQESNANWFAFSLCCYNFASSGKFCGEDKNRVNYFQLWKEKPIAALGGWEAATELPPNALPCCWRCMEYMQSSGHAGGCSYLTSAPSSPSTLPWGGSGVRLFSCCDDTCVTTFDGFLRGLHAFFFFLKLFTLLSSAMGMNKKKTKQKILGIHPHLEIADGWGRFFLLLAQNCCSPAYIKCPF